MPKLYNQVIINVEVAIAFPTYNQKPLEPTGQGL